MENLATIVFERTMAGTDAIRAAGDTIPRQLRTLLLAIDGRSPVSQYVPFLTVLAPLSEKFAQLETMGLARRRAPVAGTHMFAPPSPAAPAEAQNIPPPPQVTEAELREFARQVPNPLVSPQPAPDPGNFASALQVLAKRPHVQGTLDNRQSMAPAQASAFTEATVSYSALTSLLAHMQAYLSQAAGMEGLPVALMLEQITSLAQLRRELPSYAELVTSYGGNPEAHLKTLTGLLEQAQA